ncbi:MAG TPA: DUF4177 domain-containing protein [Chloroflexia bacterium]|nr:DUF4177 domain-containing protein [Chloroflexia bacterium]
MSERNNEPSLQGIFSQVLRDIQTGINRLEQTMNQAAQQRQGSGFPPPPDQTTTTPGQSQYNQTPPQAQSAPKAPAAPYTGQRWEYKVVYVNFRGQISSEGEQAIIGRGERRSTFVREYLDQLGQQGWELSGVSPLGDTENSYFVFKRPATGQPSTTSSSTTRAGQRIQVEEVDEDNSGIAEL